MFIDVKAAKLFFSAYAQAHQVFYRPKEEKSGSHGPGENGDDSQALRTQEFPASAKKQAVPGSPRRELILGEQSQSKGAPCATDSVDRNRSYGIV